jgi:hypothetical protein
MEGGHDAWEIALGVQKRQRFVRFFNGGYDEQSAALKYGRCEIHADGTRKVARITNLLAFDMTRTGPFISLSKYPSNRQLKLLLGFRQTALPLIQGSYHSPL